MVFRVELGKNVKRALSRLPVPVAMAVLEFIQGPLAENPYRVGKPLQLEWTGYLAARRGEYRVIYRVVEDEVLVRVVRVAHRRDVYRR